MIRIDINDLSTLTRHLPRLENGETLLLCRGTTTIAEIKPLIKKRGLMPTGDTPLVLGADTAEPLPDDILGD